VQPIAHPDLLVGLEHGDDAAVWRLTDTRALIATVDFFTPLVDDAYTWGEIAATNAASDVFAMGGRPLLALNTVSWPREQLPLELLGQALDGMAAAAQRGGWVVGGGHTIDGAEPFIGQVVIGEADPERVMTNSAARPGDTLVLTKPLGTGAIATAVKRLDAGAIADGGRLRESYGAAVAAMTTLNDKAAGAALQAGVRAATDVTGFGLAGHLYKMLVASGCGAIVEFDQLPVLAGALELISEGFVPGGTSRNLEFVASQLVGGDALERQLFADPQTSGGLLLSCPRERIEALLGKLRTAGVQAAVIGSVIADEPGRVQLST